MVEVGWIHDGLGDEVVGRTKLEFSGAAIRTPLPFSDINDEFRPKY